MIIKCPLALHIVSQQPQHLYEYWKYRRTCNLYVLPCAMHIDVIKEILYSSQKLSRSCGSLLSHIDWYKYTDKYVWRCCFFGGSFYKARSNVNIDVVHDGMNMYNIKKMQLSYVTPQTNQTFNPTSCWCIISNIFENTLYTC